jgi:hypothetical protein
VEPAGPFEDDPNPDGREVRANPTRSYRTRQPMRGSARSPGLASTSDRSAVDHHSDPSTGSPVNPDRTVDTGETPGLAEPRLWVSAHPRRVDQAGPPGRRPYGVGHPEGRASTQRHADLGPPGNSS